MQSAKSPSRTRIAVKFIRSCGNSPDDVWTEVSVLGRWSPLSGEGNAFACDAVVDDVRVSWESDHRLRISYPRKARVVRTAPSVGDVTIVPSPRS
jgi:hypothetical protein